MAETCRIVALGGLGEVGKNLTVFDCEGDLVVVDSGLAFPRDEHLGVDLVLPDYSYLRDRAPDVRAVVLTHAHEDHVGGLPYLVGEAFRQIVPLRQGRILVSSFASNVHRMQQAVDVAVSVGRKVCVVGRSMRKNVNIARNLGYMDVPEGVLVRPQELDELPPNEQMILCTGSQGEPLSALVRIAYHDHAAISVERGDTVIISAKPVPGNELRVHDAINQLAKAGAEVLHQEIAPVHVSGHACSEEIRTILSLLRPRSVMPIHGEFRMLAAHAQLARDAGVPASAIVLAENGTVVELSREGARIVDEVGSGVTFVVGLGVTEVQAMRLSGRRGRGVGARLLPPARALGTWRRCAVHGGCASGRPPARRRSRRDGARRSGATPGPVSARAGSLRRGRTLLVRRPRRGRADRVG